MSGWCDYLCDFPDDGNVALDRVLSAMPDSGRVIHTPLPMFRLRVASPGAAAMLRIAIPDVEQVNGITGDAEVLVPWGARSACEAQIESLNHGPARWTRLERIEARGDMWPMFEHLWRRQWRQWRQ
jgi:hypothetical protein